MRELAVHSVFICEMLCGKNINCFASGYLPAESGASPEKEVSTVNSLSARLARPAKKSRSAGSWPQTRSDFSGKCSESVHDKKHRTAIRSICHHLQNTTRSCFFSFLSFLFKTLVFKTSKRDAQNTNSDL